MARLLFQKTGNAIFISHLDLMRLFQRAFKRAGLPLTHSQGFNPRPSVSIALPLSVGVESYCELLDFDLDGETVACAEIKDRLNKALVSGVEVLEVYENGRKIRDLALLSCKVSLEYDSGIPEGAEKAIRELFARNCVTVEKKSKNVIHEQDIIPMIKALNVSRCSDQELTLEATICCQNPTLNPAQLTAAIGKYLPELNPTFSKCWRLEVFDSENNIFR